MDWIRLLGTNETEMKIQSKTRKEIQPNRVSHNPLAITVDDSHRVSGLHQAAEGEVACYVLAHGAGAGMRHPFLEDMAQSLAAQGVGTLRYQFPYMELGSGRPDSPKLAHATVRAAVAEAARLVPSLALFAGGKSFGGRMTSQAQAESPLPGVRGLIFLGFPLHPPGRPSEERAQHLFRVQIPMLFLQGDRDEFAELNLLRSVTDRLGSRATLKLFEGGNHSFHVPVRMRRTDDPIGAQLSNIVKDWIGSVLSDRAKQK